MKRALVLTFCLMACCAGAQASNRNSLVGEWRYADRTQSCHYAFRKDGTFSGEVIYLRKLISKFKGRWTVTGDALLYTYLSDAFGRIPAGAKDRDKLIEIQKDSFLIRAGDGRQRRYLRVR